MSYKKEYEVRIEDIRLENKATNVAILKMLEEIAERNSSEVGLGFENMPETNSAWLLLDWQIKIIKRPSYKEKVDVETWSRKIERCYGYRDFEIYNKNKELLLKGTSKWVLIDVIKRKPIRISEENIKKYQEYNDKGYDVFENEIEKIVQVPNEKQNFVRKYEVQRRDIDGNKHMNNIAYLEVANEILPFEIYQKNMYNNIRINYKKELKYGESVDCYYANIDNKHIITLKNDNKIHATIELY